MAKIEKAKARELELARRFKEIVEALPLLAINNFIQNILDAFETITPAPTPVAVLERGWGPLANCVVHDRSPPTVGVEVAAPKSASGEKRFDLVVPVPLFLISGTPITSIIFEFKLQARNTDQLQEYASRARNALVVSISKGATNGTEPAIEAGQSQGSEGQVVWLNQTWEQLYFALQNMLSGDAAARIELVKEPDERVIGFDYMLPGADRLSFGIESFLRLILSRDLLPNHELVLVVPVGQHAAETLGHRHPYYAHPSNWRSGYKHLVTIKSNEIVGVYKVVDSRLTQGDSEEREPDIAVEGLDDVWDTLRLNDLRVSALEPIENKLVGLKYKKKGPKGGAVAFTLSHRYVDSLGDVKKLFEGSS